MFELLRVYVTILIFQYDIVIDVRVIYSIVTHHLFDTVYLLRTFLHSTKQRVTVLSPTLYNIYLLQN